MHTPKLYGARLAMKLRKRAIEIHYARLWASSAVGMVWETQTGVFQTWYRNIA
jgi:hypothetical protein